MSLFPLGILSAAAGGAPVFPSDITGLVARYDADNLESISLSGSDVTQWNDLSGNARHATQGTSTNRPKSGTRTINGLNVIDFDGTNDFLFNNGIAASFTGEDKPFTVFWVQDKDVAAGTVFMLGSSVNGVSFFTALDDGTFIRDDAVVQSSFTGTGSDTLDPTFMTSRSSGLNFTAFAKKTQTVAGTAYNRGTVSLNNSSIGAFRFDVNAETFFDGAIGELVYYNRELTTTEVSTVQDYLSAKWGI